MNHNLKSTFKSKDTEEWIDVVYTRRVGYVLAKGAARCNMHPNVVTLISIVLGVLAGVMFYFQDLFHNIAGVCLLTFANFLDSADGQLARMTGKTSLWGRILDGFAGDCWFVSIYFALVFRLYNMPVFETGMLWGWWGLVLCFLSGAIFHARQCQLADYYRNGHTYYSGFGGELQVVFPRTNEASRLKRLFFWGYQNYTRSQRQMTPKFVKFQDLATDGCWNETLQKEWRSESLPLIKYANILTFNCRALVLYVACLLNKPEFYLLTEITLFSLLAFYMWWRHERMCASFIKKLENETLIS